MEETFLRRKRNVGVNLSAARKRKLAALANESLSHTLSTLFIKLNNNVTDRWPGGKVIPDYQKHYDGLLPFFHLIQDYESALVLHDYAPKRCPSMKITSLKCYLSWKMMPPGTPLCNSLGQQMIAADGLPIVCNGRWSDPGNIHQMQSAITYIHERLGQGRQYIDRCDACASLFEQNKLSGGCEAHYGNRLIFRSGNPRFDGDMKQIVKGHFQALAAYESQSDQKLLPYDVKKMRAYIVLKIASAAEGLEQLAKYTCLLNGCNHGMRAFEVCGLLYEKVHTIMAQRDDYGTILNLTFTFLEKNRKWRTFVVWRNDNVPELCTLRHLLAYVALSGVNDGYLFRANMSDPSIPMQYESLNNWLKNLF
jgi:hypothetical protein